MTSPSQSSGFHDVDRSGNAAHLSAEMATVAANEFTQRYLSRGLDILNLRPGLMIADVGCGTCPDLADLCGRLSPGGTVHLVEPSETFLREAQQRYEGLPQTTSCAVQYHHRSAQNTGLPEASLAAIRFVRVFQHVREADLAVKEAARVLAPGGRFLAIDPVWSSLALSGEDQDLSLMIANAASFRMENWMIAPKLPRMLALSGLVPEPVEIVTRTVYSFAQASDFYSLPTRLANLVERGACTRERADNWLASAAEDSTAGRFACHLPIWLISARKADA